MLVWQIKIIITKKLSDVCCGKDDGFNGEGGIISYYLQSLKIREKLIFIWQQYELKYYHGKYYWQRTVTIIWQLVN